MPKLTIKLVPWDVYDWIAHNLPHETVEVSTTDPNHFFGGARIGTTILVGDYKQSPHYQPGGKFEHVRIPGINKLTITAYKRCFSPNPATCKHIHDWLGNRGLRGRTYINCWEANHG